MNPKAGDVIVVWFSNGAASAVAWMETVRRYGHICDVRAVNNPVMEEDEDNVRFARDVEAWVSRKLAFHTNPCWPSASAEEVWRQKRAMAFPIGAPCTLGLKKEARRDYERRHKVDWHVLGFTADERRRYDRFVLGERSNVLPILIDAGLTKQGCIDRLLAAGIAPPRVYAEGYPNANCIGCPKATSPKYWNLVRRTRPEVFVARAELSRELGVRLVEVGKKRIFLDELDPNEQRGRPLRTMQLECGIFCEEKPPGDRPMSAPYNDGDVISRYIALRAERKAIEDRHKEELAPTLKAMETIENYMLGRLVETNAQSIKASDGAIAYKSTVMSVRTDDSSLLMSYVRDTNQFQLLSAAVSKDALKELMDANGGHPPPGVSVAFVTKVNFRKG